MKIMNINHIYNIANLAALYQQMAIDKQENKCEFYLTKNKKDKINIENFSKLYEYCRNDERKYDIYLMLSENATNTINYIQMR